MNVNNCHPKKYRKFGKNNSSVKIRFDAKTSNIRNFSQNITSDVKTSKVAKLQSCLLLFGSANRLIEILLTDLAITCGVKQGHLENI